MQELDLDLPEGKKIYFASDFHLGVPDLAESIQREKKIVKWLESIKKDAAALFLLGDIFDFWFEYKKAIPKGFIRIQGKLAELSDEGLPIFIFPGNHDLWMNDYLSNELKISIFHVPLALQVGGKRFLIGHGDGLGPGDKTYKILKKIFRSSIAQWFFKWIHPDIGITLAQKWSKSSRISNLKDGEQFKGEDQEFLLTWCKQIETKTHHDYYIFGHRHLVLNLEAGQHSRYINLGEWVSQSPFAIFDGHQMELRSFN